MLKSKRHRLFANCACCPQPFTAASVSRRELLAGGAALGLAVAAGFPSPLVAQAKPHRIDVHHHVVPPSWLDAMNLIGRSNPPLLHWSVQKTLDDMEKGGVATSIL